MERALPAPTRSEVVPCNVPPTNQTALGRCMDPPRPRSPSCLHTHTPSLAPMSGSHTRTKEGRLTPSAPDSPLQPSHQNLRPAEDPWKTIPPRAGGHELDIEDTGAPGVAGGASMDSGLAPGAGVVRAHVRIDTSNANLRNVGAFPTSSLSLSLWGTWLTPGNFGLISFTLGWKGWQVETFGALDRGRHGRPPGQGAFATVQCPHAAQMARGRALDPGDLVRLPGQSQKKEKAVILRKVSLHVFCHPPQSTSPSLGHTYRTGPFRLSRHSTAVPRQSERPPFDQVDPSQKPHVKTLPLGHFRLFAHRPRLCSSSQWRLGTSATSAHAVARTRPEPGSRPPSQSAPGSWYGGFLDVL